MTTAKLTQRVKQLQLQERLLQEGNEDNWRMLRDSQLWKKQDTAKESNQQICETMMACIQKVYIQAGCFFLLLLLMLLCQQPTGTEANHKIPKVQAKTPLVKHGLVGITMDKGHLSKEADSQKFEWTPRLHTAI